MSIVSIDFDGKPMNLDPKSLMDLQQASSDLKFVFGGGLEKYLDQPLSSVPAKTSADLSLNAGNPSWQLPGSPAKFSLGASAKFTITIQQPNQTLFSYNPDLENSQAQKVNLAGKAGSCYVIIEALFNISGSLSANVPAGSIGVTTSDSATAAYTVRNYKALAPSTSLKDAVVIALGGFTLPLHQATAANLSDGDCIFYEFDGAINVGFGATWGISAKVGATTISEINQSLQKTGGIASVSGLTPVTVSAGANLSLQFNWTRSFECFLQRQQPTTGQAGGALLYISAGKTSKRVIQLGADVEVKGIGTPKATVDASKATQLILSKLGKQNLPGGSAIGQKVQQAVNPYVSDVNNWLSGLTQKVSAAAGKGVALSVYYQNQSSFTSAFTWHFDFTKAQSGAAWEDSMQGNFIAALATNAVTLDPGSGYEQTSMRATGISLTLFGVWQFSDVEQFFDNASVSYVGNGRFNLEYKAGQTVTSTVNSKVYTSSIYLSATGTGAVNTTGTTLDLSNVNLQLHGELSAKGDPSQQAQFGTLLDEVGNVLKSNGGNGADLTQLARNWETSPGGNATLDVVFEIAALQRLSADDHSSGQKVPFNRDAANWTNYANASDKLGSEPVNYFRQQGIGSQTYNSYNSWRKFNCAVNGYVTNASDPTPVLDNATRVHPPTQSPLSISVLALMRQPGYFEGTSNDQDVQLGVYFGAGQEFMNLCGDTQDLLRQIASSKVDWTTLMARMKAIAGDDVNAWFGPVILLALAMSCQCKAATIQGSTLTSSNAAATLNLS